MNKGCQKEKKLIFNHKLIDLVEDGSSALDYIERIINDYAFTEDLNEMERRKRVRQILESDSFRKELEELIISERKHGNDTENLRALEQLSELILPSKMGTVGLAGGIPGHAVVPIADLRGADGAKYSKEERVLRTKLAALYRLVDLFQWSQGIYNHITGKDDPFYVMDVGKVLEKHREWCRELPRIKPYYAVKCNNDPILLAILAHAGCNFDCASIGEIENVMALGVGPNRIMYANPCKTSSFITKAMARGVQTMTFDHEMELIKIHKLCPDAQLVLRIAVSDPTAQCPLNLKFGCDPVVTAPKLLMKSLELGIKVIGISFHVGSGCRDPTAYQEAIQHSRRLFDLGAALGHDMFMLDIGGGFPGHNLDRLTFPDVAALINASLIEHFPEESQVEIIGEPGRFYATSAYTLCVNIIARNDVPANKITKNDKDCNEPGFMYYINDGVYGSFNNIMFDHALPKPTMKNETGPRYLSAVWGPTCDNMDCVLPNELLPEMNVGQWMTFQNMGAYTIAAASEFNGFPKPNIYYISTDKDAIILMSTIRRSLNRVEPLANVPEPYMAHWPMDEGSEPSSGYTTDRHSENESEY